VDPQPIRKALGIPMNGRGRIRPNVSFFFESDDFLTSHDRGVGNLYFIFAPGSFGVDHRNRRTAALELPALFPRSRARTEDVDPEEALFAMMGQPFDYKLKGTQHWYHHQSVARAFRSRPEDDMLGETGTRVSRRRCGASFPAHGRRGHEHRHRRRGRSWMEARRGAQGMGRPATCLRSYEHERKPIAVRNSVISANNSDKIDMVMAETPPEVEDDGPEGEVIRAEIARKIRWMARQFNSAGTHLGYRYVDSPVIVADGTPEPPDDPNQVVPSTWPGSRCAPCMADRRYQHPWAHPRWTGSGAILFWSQHPVRS
jgi:hypothetical protein